MKDEMMMENDPAKIGPDTGPVNSNKANGTAKPLFDKSIVDDVPIKISAHLGDAKMTVAELMDLKDGSLISLDASLNDRAELKLHDKIIGYGEVVAVGENFGIRITEIGD